MSEKIAHSTTFRDRVYGALQNATKFAERTVKDDGHWLGPMSSDVTITAEWIFLLQSIGRPIYEQDRKGYVDHFLFAQQADGSWPVAPQYPFGGNLSATIEAYLSLKILGIEISHPSMRAARKYILDNGGAEKMRIFTRFHFAMFGLMPWSAVPQMPPELIQLPSWFPINIYKFSSWARITIVPFLIIRTHEPVYPLPNGCHRMNDYLDELWLDRSRKNIPYAQPLLQLACTDLVALFFQIADIIISIFVFFSFVPLRKQALKDCERWLIDRQEPSGDWAGIFPPMHLSIYALLLQGHTFKSRAVQLGMDGLDRFVYHTPKLGTWMQPCVSPVWDTFLMVRGLVDAGSVSKGDALVTKGLEWARRKQIMNPEGDWTVYRPHLQPGGFSFEYDNTLYPDVDDTAAAILAFLVADPHSLPSHHVTCAATWILGMQNADGGWAAFDVENNARWLNRIPFSDMDALCDESCADIVGRILEAFGLMLQIHSSVTGKPVLADSLLIAMRRSCFKAIDYLERTQENDGSFFGRWGVNYVYGTSNVLCGLAYFSSSPKARRIAQRGVQWLESVQNSDGGWGETLESYVDPSAAGKGPSTPSQTAWGVMGLLPFRSTTVKSVCDGVEWLLSNQTAGGEEDGTWAQEFHTGTGFPGHFYLGYDLYRHYFPLMALGRFLNNPKGHTVVEKWM